MADKRGRRAWIKVQLADSDSAHEAAAQVKEWKTMRQAAGQLVKAVGLYAALCRGDVSLLEEYFPGLAVALGSRPSLSRRSVLPAVTYLPRPDDDVLGEALDSLGLDDLDFSS